MDKLFLGIFICIAVFNSVSGQSCTTGTLVDGECLNIITDARNYNDAKNQCGNNGGNLVGAKSQNIQNKIQDLMGDSISQVWLGGRNDYSSATGRQWSWIGDCFTCSQVTYCEDTSLDLALAIDTSGPNAQSTNAQNIKDFLKNFLAPLDIAVSKTRVALVHFASDGTIKVSLNNNATRSSVHTAIDGLPQSFGDNSNVRAGLSLLDTNIFDSTKGDRSAVNNFALIVTDAENLGDVTAYTNAANEIKAEGVKLYVVGIGNNIDSNVLANIASPHLTDEDPYYMTVSSHSALLNTDTYNTIWRRMCGSPLRSTVDIQEGEQSYLKEQGCYTDRADNRDLSNRVLSTVDALSQSQCEAECSKRPYDYAALQVDIEPGTNNKIRDKCYCGSGFGSYGTTMGCTTWCGAESTDICGGQLANYVFFVGGLYGPWGYNQPNNYDGIQYCGALDHFNDFQLADEACRINYRFLCDLGSSSGGCSNGNIAGQSNAINGRCYVLSSNQESFRLNWFKAREKCIENGGELARIDDSTNHIQITEWLKAIKQQEIDSGTRWYHEQGLRHVWIGLHKYGWTWDDGTPMSYTNWDVDEPSEQDKNCIVMVKSLGYKWKVVDCSLNYAYVCSRDPPEPTTPIEATTTVVATTITTAPETTTKTTTPKTTATATTTTAAPSTTVTTSKLTSIDPTTTLTAKLTTANDQITTSDQLTTTVDLTTTTIAITTKLTTQQPNDPTTTDDKNTSQDGSQQSPAPSPGPAPAPAPTPAPGSGTVTIPSTTPSNDTVATPVTPDTGAAAGGSTSLALEIHWIIIIVVIILLLLAIIIALIIFCCYKKNNKTNQVTHQHYTHDHRREARVPDSAIIGEEYYSDNGSTYGLIATNSLFGSVKDGYGKNSHSRDREEYIYTTYNDSCNPPREHKLPRIKASDPINIT